MSEQEIESITQAGVQLVCQFPADAARYANAGDALIGGGWSVTPYAAIWPDGRIVLRGYFAGQCDCAASRGGATCQHARMLDILIGAGLMVCERRQSEPMEAARQAA